MYVCTRIGAWNPIAINVAASGTNRIKARHIILILSPKARGNTNCHTHSTANIEENKASIRTTHQRTRGAYVCASKPVRIPVCTMMVQLTPNSNMMNVVRARVRVCVCLGAKGKCDV